MFISHTSQLFCHEAKDEGPILDNQIESGRRILRLYQEIAQQWILDGEGWLFLLTVLLQLTKSLLQEVTEESTSLGSNLADMLLQVNIVWLMSQCQYYLTDVIVKLCPSVNDNEYT